MLAGIQKVLNFEKEADISKDKLYRMIFANATLSDPITIIQMRDFVFATDGIADNASHASDVVLVLVAKGYD
jgi:uncharacterized protein Yka (UPF0111/DUF47 family)